MYLTTDSWEWSARLIGYNEILMCDPENIIQHPRRQAASLGVLTTGVIGGEQPGKFDTQVENNRVSEFRFGLWKGCAAFGEYS